MSSILSLRPRMFRTRNTLRDANTDLDRLMTVRRSIVAAIDDATRERQGLQQRLDVYHAQATNLLDNSADYAERASEDERSIREAEANGAAAANRISQIDIQIKRLGEMLAELDRAVGDNAG
jgi:chromosome segregation ATPase